MKYYSLKKKLGARGGGGEEMLLRDLSESASLYSYTFTIKIHKIIPFIMAKIYVTNFIHMSSL